MKKPVPLPLLFLLSLVCFGSLHAQTNAQASTPIKETAPLPAAAPDTKGSLTGANLYTNAALDMTLQLSGEWQFMDEKTKRMAEGPLDENDAEDDAARQEREARRKAACTGPLCGTPDINVALISQPKGPIAVSSFFIAGFKLASEYLDRQRYPLERFAEIMMPHSLADTALEQADKLTAVQLGGRPAYRLLVREPGEQTPKEVGYVVESNGYMLLLVGSAIPPSDLPKLQTAIEGVKFK